MSGQNYIHLDDRRAIAEMVAAAEQNNSSDDVQITIETKVKDPSTIRHRTAALVLSVISIFTVFFGTCCCSIPALILALVPNCTLLSKSRLVRPIYIASIVCAVLALVMAICILSYSLSHHIWFNYANFERDIHFDYEP